ncbi:MAG TPA: hypothetical protein VEI83_01675 [Acidimicrobiales bacterium]|nr:hypothetical protein [Acidimicrobiales bacterium]
MSGEDGVRLERGALPGSAEDVERALRAEGMTPTRWGNGAHYRYARHHHPYTKVLVCVRGGIVFHTSPTSAPGASGGSASTRDWPMGPGDRLELAAGVEHAASVGSEGVECVEAPRPDVPGKQTGG